VRPLLFEMTIAPYCHFIRRLHGRDQRQATTPFEIAVAPTPPIAGGSSNHLLNGGLSVVEGYSCGCNRHFKRREWYSFPKFSSKYLFLKNRKKHKRNSSFFHFS
jgi:hypothetical protein